MGDSLWGIGCRRGWAKFDRGVRVLGVTHDRGDEGRVHIWLLGRQRCVWLHTYQNITNQAGGAVGGGNVDQLAIILFQQKTVMTVTRISSIVTKKGELCCCLEYLLYSS